MTLWSDHALSEFAEIQTGPFGSQLHASDYVSVGIPSIMPTNIGNRLNIVTDQLVYVSQCDIDRLRKYTVVEGDIVYSRRGDVEKCAFIRKDQSGWLCGTGCLRIRFTSRKINPKFCAYLLSTPDIKNWIVNSAVGTTMPNLNSKILEALPLTIPEINEQNEIAEVLSSLDDKIDLLNRQNKTLEQLAETLFRQWFVEDESRSEEKSFGEFIETTVGGEWGKETPEGEFTKQVCCIRGTDIADLLVGLATRTPIRFVKDKKFESIEPRDGDLILEISGGTDDQSTGRTVYINELNRSLFPHPLVFSNFCRLIRPKRKEFSYFLYLYIQYLYNQDDFFNIENGSSGIKNLDYKYLLFELKYQLPKQTETILLFNKEVEIYFEKINKNKHQIRTLTQLRDTLLPKLMSGEVRVKM